MTLLVEFVLETIASIFVESTYEATLSKRLSLWLRILLIFIFASFFCTILFGLTALGIFLLTQGKIIEGMFTTILGVALIWGLSKKVISDLKNRAVN
ncbi:hypothetical protein [Erysipelothrix anatis]|uniref:hypothetical protein n=1 Tax=Erysipelothrix anatis TaxID=2683713 RepID=UPI00135B2553|nr:hypothetical protein [Erysipelothrix anatis]